MPTLSLGKVRPVYKGAYAAATAYTVLDRVSFNGTVYECVQDAAAGIAPSTEGDSAFWVILGAQGAKGDKGDKGDPGPQGPAGANGADGPQGIQGPKGEKGEKGDKGDTGMAGPQGIPGEKGADGTQGPQGPAGPQGPKGDTPPLSDAVNSTAQDVAASCKAVKTAYDKAVEASRIPTATAARAGIVELATTVETVAGTDNARAVTPAGLAAWGAVTGVPKGGIIAFSGTFGGTGNRFPIPLGGTTPDEHWCLCDGVTTNGLAVPDLRNRMIVGAGSKYPAGSTGGSETHTHSISGTVGATTLTEAQMPGHGHTAQLRSGYWDNFGNLPEGLPYGSGVTGWTTRTSEISHNTGSSQAHTHGLTASTGSGNSLSPYYALAYIIRIT